MRSGCPDLGLRRYCCPDGCVATWGDMKKNKKNISFVGSYVGLHSVMGARLRACGDTGGAVLNTRVGKSGFILLSNIFTLVTNVTVTITVTWVERSCLFYCLVFLFYD